LVILAPDPRHPRRTQAENPLNDLSEFPALPHFVWSHLSSVGYQVIDPKMESALAYLVGYDTLAKVSRCRFCLDLQ